MSNVEYPKGSSYQGKLFTLRERDPNPGKYEWTLPASLGGAVNATETPAPLVNADGRMEIFFRGDDRKLYHCWEHRPNGPWSEPSSLGQDGFTFQEAPSVALNQDGRIAVFVRGYDSVLYVLEQSEVNGGWGSFTGISSALASPPVSTTNADGHLKVFWIGDNDDLVFTWQNGPNGTWSNEHFSLGGKLTGLPAIVLNNDRLLEIFAAGKDGTVQHIRQKDGVHWTGFEKLGSPDTKTTPAAVRNLKSGRIDVFVRDGDGRLQILEQNSDGSWDSDWHKIGGEIDSAPAAIAKPDGSVQVFAVSGDSYLDDHYLTNSKSIRGLSKKLDSDWEPWSVIGGRTESHTFAAVVRPDECSCLVSQQGETHISGSAVQDIYQDGHWDHSGDSSYNFDFLGVWKFQVHDLSGLVTDHSWGDTATVSLRVAEDTPNVFNVYQVDGYKIAIQLADGDHGGALWTTRSADDWLGLTYQDETRHGKTPLMYRATNREAFDLINHGDAHISLRRLDDREILISTLLKMTDADSVTGQPGNLRYDRPNHDSTTEFHIHGSQLPILILSGSGHQLDLSFEDFTGYKVQNVDFSNATLKGTNFSRASEMRGTRFQNANLQGAVFDWQSLSFTGMDFTSADLSETDLRNIKPSPNAKLGRSKLINAKLTGVDLQGADLTGADLTGAQLDQANLSGANLTGANLTNTNLDGTNLTNATLDDATIKDASMNGSDLQGASILGTNIIGVDLTRAKFDPQPVFSRSEKRRNTFVDCSIPFAILGNNWSYLDLTDAKEIVGIPDAIDNLNAESAIFPDSLDLTGRVLKEANFQNATVTNVVLDHADLTRANFSQAYLKGSKLSSAVLTQADLTDAWLISKEKKDKLDVGNLEAAVCSAAIMPNVILEGAQCDGVFFDDAYIYNSSDIGPLGSAKGASFVLASFNGAFLFGMNFENADFRGASISKASLVNANCQSANFGPSTEATKRAASLFSADLRGCNMKSSIMDGSNLQEAKTSGKPDPNGFPQIFNASYPVDGSGNLTDINASFGATILGKTDENTTCPSGDRGPCT